MLQVLWLEAQVWFFATNEEGRVVWNCVHFKITKRGEIAKRLHFQQIHFKLKSGKDRMTLEFSGNRTCFLAPHRPKCWDQSHAGNSVLPRGTWCLCWVMNGNYNLSVTANTFYQEEKISFALRKKHKSTKTCCCCSACCDLNNKSNNVDHVENTCQHLVDQIVQAPPLWVFINAMSRIGAILPIIS